MAELDWLLFNRNPILAGESIEQPTQEEVKNTPQLFRAPLDIALLYGGDLTRAALSAIDIRGDREHVLVDTKVHMLMPGMFPAIPGWHTDGVPRDGRDRVPDIWLQEDLRSPRFHLLVTGFGALTDFSMWPAHLQIPSEPTTDLYRIIDQQFEDSRRECALPIESCRVYEWDWWNLHTARAAKKHEWRFLIRVTETDYQPPQSDLSGILRTQSQVYVPESFGW